MKRSTQPEAFLGAEAAIGPLFFGASGVGSEGSRAAFQDGLGPLWRFRDRSVMDLRRLLPPVTLARGELLSIEGARHARISVEHGEIWLTQAGDSRDITLVAGDSFVLQRGGVTLVQSLDVASISIAVPRNSRRPCIQVTPASGAIDFRTPRR